MVCQTNLKSEAFSQRGTSGKGFYVDHVGPERHWSTTRHHGPAGAPGPLLVHLDPAWSTLCNYTLEIVDQGGSRWTRKTTGAMVLGVAPGVLWSCFYILLIETTSELIFRSGALTDSGSLCNTTCVYSLV